MWVSILTGSSLYHNNHYLCIVLLGTQLLLSSTIATTTADTNKLVSLSHLFRQQHLPPRPTPRPSFHRSHKEKSKNKINLSSHHGNNAPGYSLPPMAELFSSDDCRGNQDHHGDYNKDTESHISGSSDSAPHTPQLTEDDRQCVDDIRKTQWQPCPLTLSSNKRSADAVMYEYHLSQPTAVSIDNTRLPSVRSPLDCTNRLTEQSTSFQPQQQQLPQEKHKLPSSFPPASSANDILTTKQLLVADHIRFTNAAAQHRIADPVADNVTACCTRDDASGNSKVAEIRLVFDNSPPSQPTTVPVIGGHRIAHQNAVTRPHTTDWGFPDRLVIPRTPATRSGMKPLVEHPAGV